MAYSELIKNFQRIRGYMREFYVYGFKTREEYDLKSHRSYDNEKRRIESYLGEYMGFHQTQDGKTVFLSIDSRNVPKNPLYKAFKAKSFTDRDITLHFVIFDILYKPELCFSLNEIAEIIDSQYLVHFEQPFIFDISTLRKKLKEYETLGIIRTKKIGRQLYCQRTADVNLLPLADLLDYFSETGPCGVIGNFLLDKLSETDCIFSFKHHYITGALDSEALCKLFEGISGKINVNIVYGPPKQPASQLRKIVPLKIYASVQNGRQYLFGYNPQYRRIKAFRLDYILSVELGEAAENYGDATALFEAVSSHLWGTSLGKGKYTEHVAFTLCIGEKEKYIAERLLREKRIGEVRQLDSELWVFSADVYDSWELLPWIRTFIGHIVAMNFSNRTVENQFKKDIDDMYRSYGIGGGE